MSGVINDSGPDVVEGSRNRRREEDKKISDYMLKEGSGGDGGGEEEHQETHEPCPAALASLSMVRKEGKTLPLWSNQAQRT